MAKSAKEVKNVIPTQAKIQRIDGFISLHGIPLKAMQNINEVVCLPEIQCGRLRGDDEV